LLVGGVLLVTYPPRIMAAYAQGRTYSHVPALVHDDDPQAPAQAPAKQHRARNNNACIVNIVNDQRVNNVQRVINVQNNKQKVVTVQHVVVVPHYVTVTKVVYVPRYITKVVYIHDPAATETPYDPAAAAYNAAMAPYATPTPTDTPVAYPPVPYP
jgi:hypothetical protein